MTFFLVFYVLKLDIGVLRNLLMTYRSVKDKANNSPKEESKQKDNKSSQNSSSESDSDDKDSEEII